MGTGLAGLGVLVVLAAGCGDDGSARAHDAGTTLDASDAGDATGDSGDLDVPLPMPVGIAWLESGRPDVAAPAMTPCPVGWREVGSGRERACAPYPTEGPATCSAGEAHFPGEPGCTVVGEACGTGTWAAAIPSDRPAVFVDDDAAPGGDGTRERPFRTIEEGVNASVAAGVIAIARGTYLESVRIPSGRTLWGACAAQTTIASGSASSTAGVITSLTDGELRDVTVGASARIGVLARSGARLVVRGVIVEGVDEFGVYVTGGAELDARDVVIRDVTTRATGRLGRGLNVAEGARATVSRALVEGAHDVGIMVAGESSLVLTDSAIVGVAPAPGGSPTAWGIGVQEGSTLALERVLVGEARGSGIRVSASHATLTDLRVREVRVRDAPGLVGRGLDLDRATTTATRVVVEHADTTGIVVLGGSARLDDVVVRDVVHREGFGRFGSGIEAGDGASVTGARWRLARVGGTAVLADTAASLSAEDIEISESLARADGNGGTGIAVAGGATLSSTRAVVETARDVGALASQPGSRLTLEDFLIEATAVRASADGGEGIWVLGASASLRRGLLSRNRSVGMLVSNEGEADVEDLVIRDSLPRALDDDLGRGIEVVDRATLVLRRGRVERSRSLGVSILTGSVATLEDLEILDTEAAACAETSCAETALGSALAATAQLASGALETAPTSASLQRFRIVTAALCGVHVYDVAGIDLAGGVISGAAVGACVQSDGYDLARLSQDVLYLDNGVNLDATSYAPPMPARLDR
ncbi:MAG: right-handed parallel beta-helix repeat-containing protein [Deltaproteobacteria bacterium]|nr:right-handed parallel beta-helix repeat-containing protein [Deltaproteobacteria bacterium]